MEHTKSKVIVYSSTDYKRFRFRDGNRETETVKSKNKRKRIIAEITSGNDILDEVPILVTEVNSHLNIEDGQNRYLIAKDMGRPVHYIIKKEKLSLYNLAKVNSNVEKWTAEDFIKSYSSAGNPHYKQLGKFYKDYGIAVGTCVALLTHGIGKSEGGNDILRAQFEQGAFEVKKKNEAVQLAEICKSFSAFSGWNGRSFVVAISRIVVADLCDFAVLLKKFNKDPSKLTMQPNWKGYVNILGLIYNYDNSKIRSII